MRLLHVLLLAALFSFQFPSRAAEPPKSDREKFSLNIRGHDLVVGDLPLDATYANLTEEQKALVRSRFGPMLEGDEPPYPINGMGPIYRGFAAAQQKFMIEETLILLADVDSLGNVTSVTVTGSPGRDMTKLLARLMVAQKYKPALCQGTPCAKKFPFRIEFTR